MVTEYRYCRVCKGEEGLAVSAWKAEEQFCESDLKHYAVVGIRRDVLRQYIENSPYNNPAITLRGWFLVKPHDDITYEDIAEAVKYG